MDCTDYQTVGNEGRCSCTGYSVMGITEAYLKSCSRLQNAQKPLCCDHGNSKFFGESL